MSQIYIPFAGAITLKDVTFNFPSRPNITILKNVSLNIEPNTVTAIVGRSGSGKSTIASLLLRLYEPQSGGILLDGVDIRELNLHWLRNNISAVSQEPVLFSGTIRENILYGLRSEETQQFPEEHFQRVVLQSYVDDFVKTLPDGYETLVGQRGMTLSGGQRQRVAIARALIRVCLFDAPCLFAYNSKYVHIINFLSTLCFNSESKNPNSRRSNECFGQRFRGGYPKIIGKSIRRTYSYNNSTSLEYNS